MRKQNKMVMNMALVATAPKKLFILSIIVRIVKHCSYHYHSHVTVEQCLITMENKLFDKSVPISMQNFLNFLKLAVHVHESISNRDVDDNDNQIDYNELATHDLVNGFINLKSGHSTKLDVTDENNDKNGN